MNSISEQIQAGNVHCIECGMQAKEPVSGWCFSGQKAWCPAHQPLGASLDFGSLQDGDTRNE